MPDLRSTAARSDVRSDRHVEDGLVLRRRNGGEHLGDLGQGLLIGDAFDLHDASGDAVDLRGSHAHAIGSGHVATVRRRLPGRPAAAPSRA